MRKLVDHCLHSLCIIWVIDCQIAHVDCLGRISWIDICIDVSRARATRRASSAIRDALEDRLAMEGGHYVELVSHCRQLCTCGGWTKPRVYESRATGGGALPSRLNLIIRIIVHLLHI